MATTASTSASTRAELWHELALQRPVVVWLSPSSRPTDLLHAAGIDADGITAAVRALVASGASR